MLSHLVSVIIPGDLWWNALTYRAESDLIPGVRVKIKLRNSERVGFVVPNEIIYKGSRINNIIQVLDDKCKIDRDLWNLAIWAGHESLCGTGAALQTILPKPILDGWKISDGFKKALQSEFKYTGFYNPFENVRYKFYLEQLNKPGQNLLIFPLKESAKEFYNDLPDDLKNNSVLWSGNIWQIWQDVHNNKFKNVISAPGGIFAPIKPDRIIIEDDSCPFYKMPRSPKINLIRIAEKRAEILNAEFITGGRMPSGYIYKKYAPDEILKPERKNIILADVNDKKIFNENIKGIEGNLKITRSILKRSIKNIISGKNVFWILNRYGEAAEIKCDNCGNILTCKKCGAKLRVTDSGEKSECPECGDVKKIPDTCPICNIGILKGKILGLGSLFEVAKKYFPAENLILYKGKNLKKLKYPSLILGTFGLLNQAEKLKPGLISWLNFDAELFRQEYITEFKAFRNLSESYWRGNKSNEDSDRKILIQAGHNGIKFASKFYSGFKYFWDNELKLREEFILPPFGLMIEITCKNEIRAELINDLKMAGIFVSYQDENSPLFINIEHEELNLIYDVLAKYFYIKNISNAPDVKIYDM